MEAPKDYARRSGLLKGTQPQPIWRSVLHFLLDRWMTIAIAGMAAFWIGVWVAG